MRPLLRLRDGTTQDTVQFVAHAAAAVPSAILRCCRYQSALQPAPLHFVLTYEPSAGNEMLHAEAYARFEECRLAGLEYFAVPELRGDFLMCFRQGAQGADPGAGHATAGARREPGNQRGRHQGPQEGSAPLAELTLTLISSLTLSYKT